MKIKSWFLYNEFTENERYVVECGDVSIERETEKAYLLKWISDYGFITRWIPKSCICSEEEIIAEENKKYERVSRGLDYNKLVA